MSERPEHISVEFRLEHEIRFDSRDAPPEFNGIYKEPPIMHVRLRYTRLGPVWEVVQ